MQLKQLVISGFKSFADTATLHFPSELVAIVGPNGCGKSNIMDAIRWVMGESSARQLRGEQMEDVIFNGSSLRKPMGRAFVEMVFDNSSGRFAGPYASYAEIAIRREVTRDGHSVYSLNQTRCRRRDILDLFLGTGARGYSIISQGEVSRLIEAKPEVLRNHLEEAAGVSQYHQRRKETVTRMERTRENLVRIKDILDELNKQLQRLEKQARDAKRYLQLKQEEKLCRATITAFKQQELIHEKAGLEKDMDGLKSNREQQSIQHISHTREKDLLQQQLQGLDIELQEIQKSFYESKTTIALLQENLAQNVRENQKLSQDTHQLTLDEESANRQIQQCHETWNAMKEQCILLESNEKQLQQDMAILEESFQKSREKDRQFDIVWQEWMTKHNGIRQSLHMTQITQENNEKRRQDLMIRIDKMEREYASISTDTLDEEWKNLQGRRDSLLTEKNTLEEQLKLHQQTKIHIAGQLKELTPRIRDLEETHAKKKTKQAVLQAAQNTCVRPDIKKYPVADFLDTPRLLRVLQVEKPWQFALECVLGESLKALVLNDCSHFFPYIPQFADHGEEVVTLEDNTEKSGLSLKIKGKLPETFINLNDIKTAATREEAILQLKTLKSHESIITPEGYWMGQGWIRIPAKKDLNDSGLLGRQQEIENLQSELLEMDSAMSTMNASRKTLELELREKEQQIEDLERMLGPLHQELRNLEGKLVTSEQKREYAHIRKNTLLEERLDLSESLETLIIEQETVLLQYQTLQQESEGLEREQIQMSLDRKSMKEAVIQAQASLDIVRNTLHQTQREQDKMRLSLDRMKEQIQTEEKRLLLCNERKAYLTEKEKAIQTTHQNLSLQTGETLQQYHHLETRLQDIQKNREEIHAAIILQEKCIAKIHSHMQELEVSSSQRQLDVQTLIVRIANLEESLTEQGYLARDLLLEQSDSRTLASEENRLPGLAASISKLGAINLAAMEECEQLCIRRDELEIQYADLQEALKILESAIEKMDRETRDRLSDTFEQVNTLFMSLFPQLFGGGKAELQWTCDNILDAGIVVMAQPPGKRNSTIQLLSGGEKALTAIALVFAIFQQNPAPFCMLDEVDAPLDDINVSRFCSVVKDMSKFVQFLFITHNKVTMEMAKQLIGVTTREPGVSRLVAVDIKQVLNLE